MIETRSICVSCYHCWLKASCCLHKDISTKLKCVCTLDVWVCDTHAKPSGQRGASLVPGLKTCAPEDLNLYSTSATAATLHPFIFLVSLVVCPPPPLVHSLRLSFCCRLWPLFFYSHHVSSLIILSLSWVCSSSVPFLVIFAHCQWFLQFLLIRPIFVLFLSACNPPPLCLLADSSRSQAGQGIWVFDMAHKAEGHRTMSACTSIIGCIMYTCVHTHIYTCTLCTHLLIPIPAFCIMGERT